eukprot:820221-Rhodomonas_salina.1
MSSMTVTIEIDQKLQFSGIHEYGYWEVPGTFRETMVQWWEFLPDLSGASSVELPDFFGCLAVVLVLLVVPQCYCPLLPLLAIDNS